MAQAVAMCVCGERAFVDGSHFENPTQCTNANNIANNNSRHAYTIPIAQPGGGGGGGGQALQSIQVSYKKEKTKIGDFKQMTVWISRENGGNDGVKHLQDNLPALFIYASDQYGNKGDKIFYDSDLHDNMYLIYKPKSPARSDTSSNYGINATLHKYITFKLAKVEATSSNDDSDNLAVAVNANNESQALRGQDFGRTSRKTCFQTIKFVLLHGLVSFVVLLLVRYAIVSMISLIASAVVFEVSKLNFFYYICISIFLNLFSIFLMYGQRAPGINAVYDSLNRIWIVDFFGQCMNAEEFKTQRRIKTVATRFGDLSLLGLLLLFVAIVIWLELGGYWWIAVLCVYLAQYLIFRICTWVFFRQDRQFDDQFDIANWEDIEHDTE